MVIKPGELCRTQSIFPKTCVDSSVLMIEMMAQTAGILLGSLNDYKDDVVFAKMEFAEFFETFPAGHTIQIEAVSESLKAEGAWFDVVITEPENKKKVASAKILLMNAGKLNSENEGSTTFHPSFMNYFRVREKIAENRRV